MIALRTVRPLILGSSLVLLALQAPPVAAAAGDLDGSFGSGGTKTTNWGGASDVAFDVLIQPEGMIVVAGQTDVGGNYDLAVARYRPGGAVDGGFSGDGRVRTAVGSANDYGRAVALQDDGKLVVVGEVYRGAADGYDFGIVRYTRRGKLDGTFGGDGKVLTTFSAGADSAEDVVVQPDGRIVVAGYVGNPGATEDFGVARYKPNGSLDTSFGGDGKVRVDFNSSIDGAFALTLQPDGRIVVAGSVGLGDGKFGVIRLLPSGRLDGKFSGDGRAHTDISTGADSGYGVAVQDDGRIVLVGNVGDLDFGVVRFTRAGKLDDTFSGDGKRRIDFNAGLDQADAVAIQPNGKIVVVGKARIGADDDFAVARLTARGGLDDAFAGDGTATTVVGGADDFAHAVALAKNGKIVLAGSATVLGELDFALARFLG